MSHPDGLESFQLPENDLFRLGGSKGSCSWRRCFAGEAAALKSAGISGEQTDVG